ncbi:hypothetical protein, partial [Bacillus cereus]|uniref:hypothetical protein n=1 Tax=Bacillus cereus TaxID=1396 RepID=UPI001A7E435F
LLEHRTGEVTTRCDLHLNRTFLNFLSNTCLKRRIQRDEQLEALMPGGAQCSFNYSSTGLAK